MACGVAVGGYAMTASWLVGTILPSAKVVSDTERGEERFMTPLGMGGAKGAGGGPPAGG